MKKSARNIHCERYLKRIFKFPLASLLLTMMLSMSFPRTMGFVFRRRRGLSYMPTFSRPEHAHVPSRSRFPYRTIIGSSGQVSEPILTGEGFDDWRSHAKLNPTIQFKSWKVPISGKAINSILNSPIIQEYLATRHELVQAMHTRLKVVRDAGDGELEKLILLQPDTPRISELPDEVQLLLQDAEVRDGDDVSIQFSYRDFTASHILQEVLPESVHPPTTSFETIGHVAHLNLPANHLPYKTTIGEVLLETLPLIETVIHKVGEVSGRYRTYEIDVLAGHNSTKVSLVESGVQLRFDVSDVYWCSRLSEERRRLMKKEFKSNQTIADPFSGVGALCIQAASKLNCTIWANDWNPKAVDYLRDNAIKNNVEIERIRCGDAYDFLMDMGLETDNLDEEENARLPDHVVMNFPLKAPEFLGALRWWPVPKKDGSIPRVHVYTFARAAGERSAEDVAVDMIATNLFGRNVTQSRTDLDNEYQTNIAVHQVRDVAPGKVVVCVSFSATPELLRYIQGEF